MQIRTITQVKVFVLYMNPISGQSESSVPVAAATELNNIIDWYGSQKCEYYQDGWMNKFFTKGSELESYNPIPTFDVNPSTLWHHGIYTTWVEMYNGIDSVRNTLTSKGIRWLA